MTYCQINFASPSVFLKQLHFYLVKSISNELQKEIFVQQNPMGSDPVGSEPHWEAILNFQKEI